MSGWPITLGLGRGGVRALLLAGLGIPGAPPSPPNPRRTLIPVTISGYAGRDFPALSEDAEDVFAIDLSVALDPGDALVPASLAVLFYPIVGNVPDDDQPLDGPPSLIGTLAVQAVSQPAATRYLLGFTCGTANGRAVALYSFFNSMPVPNEST